MITMERVATNPSESNKSDLSANKAPAMVLLNPDDIKMECEYDDCEPDKLHVQQISISEIEIKQEPCNEDDIKHNDAEIIMCKSNNFKLEELSTNDTKAYIVDDKVIIQETIFLNHVKKELNETVPCCYKSNMEYELNCTKCPMLVRILNNHVPNGTENSARNTLPRGILEIKTTFSNVKVYALKVIPEGIIFGPFEGLDSIPGTAGSTWRLKGGKMVYPENPEKLNWMQYIGYAVHSTDQNLLAFQHGDYLYYHSTRKINKGEELLVYYCEEQAKNLEDEESEMYLCPTVVKTFKNVYACTYCCLGYNLEWDLLRHKLICCSRTYTNVPIEGDLGILQCSLCKMFMEKEEYTKYHITYCREKNSRTEVSHVSISTAPLLTKSLLSNCTLTTSDGNVHLHDPSIKPKRYECKKCIFKTSKEVALTYHMLNKHEENTKLIVCPLCGKEFTKKSSLKKHLTFTHDVNRDGDAVYRTYKCPCCAYENKFRGALRQHLKLHSKVSAVYQCEYCSYKTDNKHRYEAHAYTHDKAKNMACQVCGREFKLKKDFLIHIKFEHDASVCRIHRCEKCDYVTDRKYALKIHMNVHDISKNYKCTICSFETIYKQSLDQHLLNHTDVKQFICPKCPYRSNRRYNYQEHMLMHDDVKPYNCETCGKQFTKKRSFALHIKNKHGGGVDIERVDRT